MTSRHRTLLLLALLALAIWPVGRAQAARTHTVQRGENLTGIAALYGLTVADLLGANPLPNPNLLLAGQKLLIPDAAAPETPTAVVHRVRQGENLGLIAAAYGVSVNAIQAANQLANPHLIYNGQELLIPTGGEVAPLPTPAPAWRQIVVDKSDQRAYLYQDGQRWATYVVSTGQPGSETWEGVWHIRSKIPNAYAALWNLQMPYWLGFYSTGYLENGFHALPILPGGAILWDGYLGTPVSYGCVILSYPDAQALYNWAQIGDEVVVQP